jgi:ribonuclease-3
MRSKGVVLTDIAAMEKAIGVSFKDRALLELALVHSSYCNENPILAPESNERLEFFGDAVLGFIIAEKLYRENPALTEGELSKLRAELVRRETLAEIADRINLGNYLYMGKGEDASGGRKKPANLASALEALIAAVFLDWGMTTTRGMVLGLLREGISHAAAGASANFKSRLQELLQSKRQHPPKYHTVAEDGPPHDRTFMVEVMVNGNVLGVGHGKSKKEAEMDAARSALEKMDGIFTD